MPLNKGPWNTAQLALPRPPQVPPFPKRLVILGVLAAAIIAALVFSSLYVVQPTEMAGCGGLGP